MSIKLGSLVVGMATYVPGLRSLTGRKTGGTVSARYCYSVWLRHLSMLHASALPTKFETAVELGPGDSLGIGLAAILSGAERYLAVDAIRYADNSLNLQIFEELIALFRAQAPIPDDAEFPLVQPSLPSYAFPADVLTSARLDAALSPKRLDLIRACISNPPRTARAEAPVCYIVPWEPGVIRDASVDLVLSQSVLEYPCDLAGIYSEMRRWLKPGGVMSHEIDFKSMGLTTEWNGHWSCSDAVWRLAAGRRRNRLNREPHSTHIALVEKMGCRIVRDERIIRPSGITRAQLAPRFHFLVDDDLTTSSALIQAVKPFQAAHAESRSDYPTTTANRPDETSR
jgi:SAM-dependent methyltransferase